MKNERNPNRTDRQTDGKFLSDSNELDETNLKREWEELMERPNERGGRKREREMFEIFLKEQ